MSDYKYFVTFRSKNDDHNPGVSIYQDENTRLHHLKGLDYPHLTRGAGVYTGRDEFVIRAVTGEGHGNLFEIYTCDDGLETYLKGSWKDCRSITTYRDCSVIVNRHAFLVNPEDIQLELHAGGDWERNQGCDIHEGTVYVVSRSKKLWKINLQGWSVGCETKEVNLTSDLHEPMFVAVDPSNGLVYIGDKNLMVWDGKMLRSYISADNNSVQTEDATAGGITTIGNDSILWFSSSNGNVKKVNLTKRGQVEDTGLKSNGLGFV